MGRKSKRVGKLPPQYKFFLNPYTDVRFTYCPKCERKMRQRKLPLFIHVDPSNPVVINFTCRYCPDCDLLIAHKDRLEAVLAHLFTRAGRPDVLGSDYLVIGTIDRSVWHEREMLLQHTIDHLHDFRETLIFEPAHYGWVQDPAKDRGTAAQ